MIKKSSRLFFSLVFVLCFFISWISFAAEGSTDNSSLSNPFPVANPNSNALTLNASQFGLKGPFSVGINYDSLVNYTINAAFNQKLTENFALGALLDYGSDLNRFGLTLGFKLFDNDLIKLSAERLDEKLPFSFESGDIDERMTQNAFGARYQYVFANSSTLKDIGFGGYYANTPNKSLDDVFFTNGGTDLVDHRKIAGATSSGADISADLELARFTALTGHLYYDTVDYDKSSDMTSSDDDNDEQGFGAGLQFTQILARNLMLSLGSDIRKIYDTYDAKISWLPSKLAHNGFELALQAQHLSSHDDTPSSDSIGLQLTYNPALVNENGVPTYHLPTASNLQDVGQWVSTPAVHMDRVLAIAEERVDSVETAKDIPNEEAVTTTPEITSVASSGDPLSLGATATIRGHNFVRGAIVECADESAIIRDFSPEEITVFMPKIRDKFAEKDFDITVINPDGKYAKLSGILAYLKKMRATKELPIITKVSPNSWADSAGKPITITGANFTGTTKVRFGLSEATNIQVVDDNNITVAVPENKQASNAVPVTVTTPLGVSAVSQTSKFYYGKDKANMSTATGGIIPNYGPMHSTTSVTITLPEQMSAFTSATINGVILPPPGGIIFPTDHFTTTFPMFPGGANPASVVIKYVSATTGQPTTFTPVGGFIYDGVPNVTTLSSHSDSANGGSTITITGTGFLLAKNTGSTVKFGIAAASFIVTDDKTINATVPAKNPSDPGLINVTVQTSEGTSTTSSNSNFKYYPVVSSLNPTSGTPSGGTSVTISGAGFANATAVKFNTTNVSSYHVDSDTQITITTPAGAGIVNVSVTTEGGTGTLSNAFTYKPEITSLSPSPAEGPTNGGTTVDIYGSGFASAYTSDHTQNWIKFGDAFVTANVTVYSSTHVKVISPKATTSGTVDVTISNTGVASDVVPKDQFKYVAPPTITSFTPTFGPIGQAVTIIGSNLENVTAVNFGNTPADQFNYVSPNIQALAPTPPSGTIAVVITVTSSGGIASKGTFTYSPIVTSLSVSHGTKDTSVTIIGKNFSNNGLAPEVKFGNASATLYGSVSDTQISVHVPDYGTGVVDVTVKTQNGGQSAPVTGDKFTYDPHINSIDPTQGPENTLVTITGQNFDLNNTGTATVKFGNNSAAVVSVTDTQIKANAPSGSGAVDIRVTTSAGYVSAINTSVDRFTYGPGITGISPNKGSASGGTSVVISGGGFTGATAVKFGNNSAASYTVDNDQQITAVSPPGSSTVDIRVTGASGVVSAINNFDKFSYLPVVTGVSPDKGSSLGETSVTITGSGFSGSNTTVNFGSNPATNVDVVSDTKITATSPAAADDAASSTVDVTVVAGGNSSAIVPADKFTYLPLITEVKPNYGPGLSTKVTIKGKSFENLSGVKFGSLNASDIDFGASDNTTVIAFPPDGTGTVDVTVITTAGVSDVVPADKFSYAPVITSISPNYGSESGDTEVTINGKNFSGATGGTVNFGGNSATIESVSDTQIKVRSPAGTGVVDVVVHTPQGGDSAITSADKFTYVGQPTVKVSPHRGPLANAAVTISGTNFIGVTAVNFGAIPAASFNVINSTTITAIAPTVASPTGVHVTVTSAGGTSAMTFQDLFVYVAQPTVTGVSPNIIPLSGGDVTITGTGFLGGLGVATINFGTIPAVSYHIVSGTQIKATAPSVLTPTTVHVTVTTPGGTSTTSIHDQVTYANLPVINSVSPNSGPLGGGNTITISGSNFIGTSQILFGTVPVLAGNFTVNMAGTQITAVVPAGTSLGSVDIKVTTPLGSSIPSATDQYTYTSAAVINGFSPTGGPLAGGILVKITGQGFTGALAVKFGNTPAQRYTVDSDTQITATTPVGVAGPVHIVVSTNAGNTTSADQFTYLPVPVVTSISPTVGSTAGGTLVTINGTDLTQTTAVNFNGKLATNIKVISNSQITALSPAGAGTIHVTVTTPGGTSETSPLDLFTYVSEPTVSSIMPFSGPLAGGTSVIIHGTNFINVKAVKFGSINATSYIVDSNTNTITAVSPAGSGTVDITVSAAGGTSTANASDKFTYK